MIRPEAKRCRTTADLSVIQIYAMDADKGTIFGNRTTVSPRVVALSLMAPQDDSSFAWLPEWSHRFGQEAPAEPHSRIRSALMRAPLKCLNKSHLSQNASNKPGARPRIYMLRSKGSLAELSAKELKDCWQEVCASRERPKCLSVDFIRLVNIDSVGKEILIEM